VLAVVMFVGLLKLVIVGTTLVKVAVKVDVSLVSAPVPGL